MKLMKRKTRQAIRKSIRKAVNKHGPDIAGHLATAAMAGLTTLIAAEPKKSKKKLKKLAHAVRHSPPVRAITEKLAGDEDPDDLRGSPKTAAGD